MLSYPESLQPSVPDYLAYLFFTIWKSLANTLDANRIAAVEAKVRRR